MTWDTVWEKIFQSQSWGRYPGENLIQFTARNFYQRQREEIRILELGCGPGPNIWYLSREGFDVYGVDGSSTAIEQAEKRLKEEGLKAHLKVGDIRRLDYPDSFFDAVIDNECLYANSFQDCNVVLKEVHRVLKEDGLFYSRTFRHDMYVGKKQKKVGELEYTDVSDGSFGGKGFVRLMDRNSIDNLYGKFLRILSVDKIDYTYNNQANSIHEWIVIGQKKRGE
jgi:ubiquinone/menaquinone biosynthesis C-methylase UbiE